jgi:uncharacterized membrane protein
MGALAAVARRAGCHERLLLWEWRCGCRPQFEVQNSGATYSYLMAIPVALMGAIELFMLCMALGVRLDVARIIPALVFVMLILMGNPMGKVRRNFFIGIRTPWTLASERVWYATHRLAGKLMVGVACWACSLAGWAHRTGCCWC